MFVCLGWHIQLNNIALIKVDVFCWSILKINPDQQYASIFENFYTLKQ